MRIIRRDPNQFLSSLTRWPTIFDDEEWVDASRDLSMYETDDELVVKANIAGVPADKVDVSIEGGVVTIRADHHETEEEKSKRKIVYREARSAQYVYTASVPTPIKSDLAKAEVKNGVLVLTIPKAEEAKPKKIKVLAESTK